ncbi:hypothetical protein RND81_04G212300 [Saponaria officinalis]|uniref:DOG1 domain-containing protein n=1 Tax=Saponaria officinalis TaxID=3572 RepID=A0AAW1LFS6_SAPOF
MSSSNALICNNNSDLIYNQENESELFSGFFEIWLGEQNCDLEALIVAVNAKPESAQLKAEWTRSLSELVDRVMSHYENYYRVKSESVDHDVVGMLSPSWRSHLEDAFLWVGGWRPSMAFHLLYSILGLQFEAGFSELTRGLSTDDLANLSPSQLALVNDLQCRTIKAEKALTEALAAHQETVADTSMVELSHLATELTREPNPLTRDDSVGRRVDAMLAVKEDKLVDILHGADGLRVKTLKKVVEILSPIQAAHFLIGAAELHLRVHEWGTKREAHLDT